MSFYTVIYRTSAAPLEHRAAAQDAPHADVAPWVVSAWTIVLAAIVLRYGQFGNAIAGLDEQFYLLVGDRIWAGELPYADIWDRKPLGLFALFAAIRLLPGNGVLAAQLVATAFAIATGWLIVLLARRTVGWVPATMAAVFYIAGAGELWAGTTQTPIFYNALVAGAALLTLRATTAAAIRPKPAVAAMLLAGIAIQIKTNALFEGAFFGAWMLWHEWTRTRLLPCVARIAGMFALAGAVPTLAAIASYVAIGQFDAWWQANILSIIAKGRPNNEAAVGNFWETVILMAPVGMLALAGLRRQTVRFGRWKTETVFVLGWIVAGMIDFVAIGGYFPHYAVPLLLACTPLVASAFALPRWRWAAFALSLAWPLVHSTWLNPRVSAKESSYAQAVVAALPTDVRSRCLFIYEGPVIYYHLTQACRVTRYAFTAYLSSSREAPALGVDAAAELDATMARRPGTVITVAGSRWQDRSPAMERRLSATLIRDYRPTHTLPYRLNPADGRLVIWRRNGLS